MTDVAILILLGATLLATLYLIFDRVRSGKKGTDSLSPDLLRLKEEIPLLVENRLKEETIRMSEALSREEKRLGEEVRSLQESFLRFQGEQKEESAKAREAMLGKSVEMGSLSLKAVQEAGDKMREEVEKKLLAISEKVDLALRDGFRGNQESLAGIQERLAKIDEAQRHLDALQKDVVSLNAVLRGNQTRGRYGELQLEMLLEKAFPEGRATGHYEIQRELPGTHGEVLRPDASIILMRGDEEVRLPIDSKFPFDSYGRYLSEKDEERKGEALKAFKSAVRERAKDVMKYVGLPGTMDQAILFIPSEGIFATIENEFPDLVDEFRSRGVLFASPTILLALIVIIHGNEREMKRSKESEEIRKNLVLLGKEFERLGDRWEALVRRVKGLDKDTDDLSITVRKINRRFVEIEGGEGARQDEVPEAIEGSAE